MISFECDYNNGAHPQVLKHLVETNLEPTLTYGFDCYSEQAKVKIKAFCKAPKADVFFLVGGTQTNATVIDGMLRSYEAVITVPTGHIAIHEAGAIEACGHKVITIEKSEKLSAQALKDYMEWFMNDESRDHLAQPGMVYISLPTEYGTLYTTGEIEAIERVCHEYGLSLFIDGARLGYALASSKEITLSWLARHCDAFYIGGTKVGALCGEAVVFTKNNRPPHFMTSVKKRGALLAKGRLLGIQFDTLFTDDLYFKISRHAIDMAERVKEIIREKGWKVYMDSPTNQQLILMTEEEMDKLGKTVIFDRWGIYDDTHTIVRLATSWSTTEEDIAVLAEA